MMCERPWLTLFGTEPIGEAALDDDINMEGAGATLEVVRGSLFDPLNARLADISAPEPIAQATRFRGIIARTVLQPCIARGKECLVQVRSLEERFRKLIAKDTHPGMDADTKINVDACAEVQSILLLLLMLLEPRTDNHLRLTNKNLVNQLLAGQLYEALGLYHDRPRRFEMLQCSPSFVHPTQA